MLEPEFLQLFIGHTVPDLGLQESKEVVATAIAIAICRKVLGLYVDDWEMLVLKADRWLARNAKDYSKLIRRAESLF